MKSTVEVEDRLRELLIGELGRRLTRETLPQLCSHNHRHSLDHRRVAYGEPNEGYNRITQGVEEVDGKRVALPVVQTIGLCMLGAESVETWPGSICEEPIDAQRCPYFEYKVTRTEVYNGFLADLSNPAWVERSLPAVHSLLWVLGALLRVHHSRPRKWWTWFQQVVLRRSLERFAYVSVYLPTLDAWPDENRAGTPTHH